MKCPKCQYENPGEARFCNECGSKLELACPECGKVNPLGSKFCNECGQRLEEVAEAEKILPEAEGERKHVTVLFSDLSGYTAMTEKLDPEDVKEIMRRLFGEITQIISKYDGFIEKFIGDAVMAVFGVPTAHEDDPVRAIRAATEIHHRVEAISPELEDRIGRPLSMHSGVNTGLVVTGEVDAEKGTYGLTGDAVNVASRLEGLAKAGEILVGPDTYRQAEGHFTFESLEPTMVKGKAAPVQVHKVLSQKEKPNTIHRLSGLRSDLIGRKMELAELSEAVEKLHKGKGRIFSICGDAGTGKSRLVEEFKATLDLDQIQWIEGHAYAYSQNIPYFPLIDLYNRVFQIEEGDPPQNVREKIEFGIECLVGKKESVVPYVCDLYSLNYPEVDDVSPEFLRSRLQEASQAILTALAKRAPTIFFLEDLHWADPSFVELLRRTCLEIRQPAIVLCVYRPTFSLFTGHQVSSIVKNYQDIQLQNLSLSDAQNMLESLLKTESIPSYLKRLVQSKAEGNPFYLEELVNTLIESETLVQKNGVWKLTRHINESDISSSIHALISDRVDRLETFTKRILQEASVIGRAFLYEILIKITELEDRIEQRLSALERLDLIRTRSFQPDLEYMFKHALTQEVVYNGLLKKERQEIHEQIALVMESAFQDRVQEFYETLAFHFSRGKSVHKAVDYLMKSGEKSLKKYAVEESHEYYKEAYNLLLDKGNKISEKNDQVIDLLIKWAYVFYYRGDFKGLTDVLSAHVDMAESLDDKAKVGMFYAWMGLMLWEREKYRDAYQYLHKSLDLGEKINNKKIIGYACCLLAFTYGELGLLGDETIGFGKRAEAIAEILESDHYLYFKTLFGLAQIYGFRGEIKKAYEVAKKLLDYGNEHHDLRSLSVGYYHMGFSQFTVGNFLSALDYLHRAIEVSVDPFYSQCSRCLAGACYVMNGQFQEAEAALVEVLAYSQEFGCDVLTTPASLFLGVVLISKGKFNQGLNMIEDAKRSCLKNERRCYAVVSEYVLGKVCLQIVEGAGPLSLSTIAKNFVCLIKNVPFVDKKAERHFNQAIETAIEIGTKVFLGLAYLDLGLLHRAKKRKDQAKECISEAVQLFEQCEAEVYLKQAKEALMSLG